MFLKAVAWPNLARLDFIGLDKSRFRSDARLGGLDLFGRLEFCPRCIREIDFVYSTVILEPMHCCSTSSAECFRHSFDVLMENWNVTNRHAT